MLWTSVRFGWGNTAPVILLALLPFFAAPGLAGREPPRPDMVAQVQSAKATAPAAEFQGERLATVRTQALPAQHD